MAKPSKTPATPATTNVQAPAAATQAAPAPASAAPVNPALAVVYTTGKAYNVRPGTAQSNARSWQAIQAVLAANGGQATMAQLQAAVAPFNHVPFVQYTVRRGWLVPYVAPVATASAPAAVASATA